MKKENHVHWGLLRFSFVLILISFLLLASQQNAWSLEKADSSDFGNPRANHKILEGIHLLYNLQFEDAEILFQEVVHESPDKPAGYFYLAMVTWSRMVAGFWSPEMVIQYKARIDQTVDVATTRIKKKGGESDDYFYLGGALGFLGRFEMMRRNWFSSFLVSKKAIKALKICIEMDPENRDVLLGLGTFDYYTARLSGVLKFLTYLLLHKGDTREGLRKLHIAAEQAVYSGTESKSVLLHIYLFLEDDCSEALPLARELGEKYDQDPTWRIFQGVACIRLGKDSEYRDTLSYMHRRSLQSSSLEKSLVWKRRVLYLESIHDLFHARYSEARSKLEKILMQQDTLNDPAMVAWPIVKIGVTYDLEGDRKTAKGYYRRVLNMENGSGAQFMAEKYLDDSPKEKDPFLGY